MASASAWVADERIRRGDACSWWIGPLRLTVRFEKRGATLIADRIEDARATDLVQSSRDPAHIVSASRCGLARYVPCSADSIRLRLTATTADRPVVVRPADEVVVPPGATLEFFMSTPIWLVVTVDNAQVFDVPTWRPSDTWFGPDTLEGVLAYAGRTALSPDVSDMSASPARCFTRATLRNQAKVPFGLDRMALPMPSMSLYWGDDARMWTDAVEVEAASDGAAQIRLMSAPNAGGHARRIQEPRSPRGAASLIAAFSSWFGGSR